jgi:hypothetical protein
MSAAILEREHFTISQENKYFTLGSPQKTQKIVR